ncbi:MAG: DNA polymerase III subunit gamma/tau, partial [Undibacterium sp.]|nr:DNA polymerase III subunit gamma/tau [Undibacterium sp.]
NARFKVYMIDEVHMLTNHAFNSMLKTLEEPPAHVKFILATTDPQKIPVTVLSRCLQFNLKQMPPNAIVSHLDHILGQEQIEFELPALRLLAQGAHGSMRDALSLTDQAIAYAAGKVTLDAVQSMLGALDQSYLIRVLDALAQKDGQVLLVVADEMAARSLSYKSALQDLGTLLHQIAIAQLVPAALAEELPERTELLRLAQVFDKEEVQLFYQIAVHGRNEIGLAPDEYAGFTMCLLRMLAFRPSVASDFGAGTGSSPPSPARAPSTPISTPIAATRVAPTAQQATIVTSVTSVTSISKSIQAPNAVPVPSVENKAAISPAMAALAAARAGSNKAANTQGGVRPVPVVTAVPATPIVPVTIPVAPIPKAIIPVEDNQMPPPWDEYDFDASLSAPTATNQAAEPPDYVDWPEAQVVAKAASIELMATEPVVAKIATIESAAVVVPDVISPVSVAPESNVSPTSSTLQLTPIAELNWDGHWPNLAASLELRGVAQQLAQQSELRHCAVNGNVVTFKLCVPLQTLLSSGSVDKLISALTEKFASYAREIRVDTEIGAVAQTANAQAQAERAVRQVQAEQAIQGDSFVQSLIRDFGATILNGSIRPV